MEPAILARARGTLWGLFIFDALAMPVHWYYNTEQLKKDFGRITTYHAPKAYHPDSIMALSNTGGHGRGGQEGSIIGDVINHGKKKYWGVRGVHYHQGMQAGENTLNALCARMVTRTIAANGGRYDASHVLDEYVKFMTTPSTHNDTYAESFHRDFFANYARGVPATSCARGTEGHNTAQIGGLVMLPPVILASQLSGATRAAAVDAALTQLRLTHDSKSLEKYAAVYAALLYDLVAGAEPKARIAAACGEIGRADLVALAKSDIHPSAAVAQLGAACYITSSLPVVLFLAYRYATTPDQADAGTQFSEAAFANVNAGGENCHRGSAAGALLGAMAGGAVPAPLQQGLHDSVAIAAEIDGLVGPAAARAAVAPQAECE